MIEGYHYQNAYVTRNIDKAVDAFRSRSGVTQVSQIEVTTEVWTPKGSGPATNRLAFIWVDNMQYELIEPVSGLVDIYSDALPADDGLKFHHAAMRVTDWNAFRARVEQAAYPVAMEGGSDLLKYLYLDARDHVGHYFEYVWATDERWKAMGVKS